MKRNSGMTMMEMLLVIGIISILSAVAIPNLISWRNNMQFNAAIRMVRSAIEETRMNAIKSNMPARIDFTDGGDSFDTAVWDQVANDFADPVTHPLPPGVLVSSSNFTGDQLVFTPRGMPAGAFGGTVVIENSDGNRCMQIVVASVGSARIDSCSP